MHPNPAFRGTATDAALAMARDRGFGVLSVNGDAGPLAAHVPFLIDATGASLRLHLARSNAIARAALPLPAVMIVSGPDAYVSPDWYGAVDQVPTWNYVAIHLRGTLHPLPAEAMEPLLIDQSAAFEARLPKKPWTMAKMSDEAKTRMMRMILPFRMEVSAIESTVKLNQNKAVDLQAGAAAGIAAHPVGLNAAEIAAMMQARLAAPESEKG